MMKVVIYARVSTDDKEQNPERQILKCKEYCDLKNHEVVETIEEYMTGDSNPFKRPKGERLLELKHEGIVIFSMDRLTREHPIKVIQMLNNMKNQGIKIISITEPAFNMESEFSDLLIYMMTWFNNYFLTKLKRDTKAGMERARKEGKIIGRPKIKFNQYRAYQLLFIDKLSQRKVSEELGVSLTSINRFKRVAEKNPDFFIKEDGVSKPFLNGT